MILDNIDIRSVLIHLPNWLGDAVMATPAVELLKELCPNAVFTVVGSRVAAALFSRDSRVSRVIVDDSKSYAFRLYGMLQLASVIGRHDVALTFRNNFLSALFLRMTSSPVRIGFAKEMRSFLLTHAVPYPENIHQTKRFALLPNALSKVPLETKALALVATPVSYERPTLGIAPGAAFGEAKRWYGQRFAQVAAKLSSEYDIVLFGSPAESTSAQEIESGLREFGIANVHNLAGRTCVEELVDRIASLSLFLTNDSGPMHIAAAFGVPTVAIFGPTDASETSPWMHEKCIMVRKELKCSPCKKRVCPLGHHDCMRLVTVEDVLEAVASLSSLQDP